MSTSKLLLSISLLAFSIAGVYYGLLGIKWLWLFPMIAAVVMILPYLYGVFWLIFDRETPVQKIDRIHKKWRQDNPDR